MAWLEQFDSYLIWFALATALLALEAILGSFRFLAASIGALIVGGLSYLYPYVSLPVQFLFFCVLSGVFIWIATSHLKARQHKIEKLQRIVAEKAYVGRELTLRGGICGGRGSIDIDGVVWKIEGPDCPAGSRVKVVDMGPGTLAVEPSADG